MESVASRPVSVAERASWLLDLSTKNREKQQSLAPPKRTVNTFASIRDKVQLFEQMTHPDQPASSSQDTRLSEHPVLSESFSSSSSSSNTRTTSTSSTADEPVTPPPPAAAPHDVSEPSKKDDLAPKPFIRAEVPILRDFNIEQAKESAPTTLVRNNQVASNIAAPCPASELHDDDDARNEEDHVVAIVQLANKAKKPSSAVTPLERCQSPSPWDESDNFSDPWMMEPPKDTVTFTTTSVNIPPSWHPNALLSNNTSQSSHGSRSHVFVDTDTEDDDDDIHTVVGELDVRWMQNSHDPSRESLSHLLQPPFIAQYAKNDTSFLQKDDTLVGNGLKHAAINDATSSDNEKDVVRRVKSQNTRIPTLDRREMGSSVRSKKSWSAASMENRDPAKSTDVTGSWFVHTFDNEDDVSAASALFPPSPLDLQYDAATNTPSQTPSITAPANLPRSLSPPVIRRFPMGSVSIPMAPSRLMTHDITSTNAYTTAFLGNVFAEEMVAAASGNGLSDDVSIAQTSIVRPKSAFVLHPKPMSPAEASFATLGTATRRPCLPSLDASDKSLPPLAMKPKSDRISSTIAQLYQGSGGGNRFQRKSLVQTRQEQLATKLAKDRVKNHTTRGLWQKDANGNFKKQFVLVEDRKTKAVK